MFARIKRRIPTKAKSLMKSALSRCRPPELAYMELHLTDHCNLNCRGCTHFCPVATPHYADLSQHQADMRRLRQLFHNIREIRLMGGEPLLHPAPASFVTATRAAFPRARMRFVTNGIDIHAPRVTGRAILRQLRRPIETCRWCSCDFVPFLWSTSERQLREWEAAAYRAAQA